jgi:hypothetical protein
VNRYNDMLKSLRSDQIKRSLRFNNRGEGGKVRYVLDILDFVFDLMSW